MSISQPQTLADLEPAPSRSGLTWRSVLLGIIFLALGNIWVRYASLITFGANIDNSVPPGPALGALLLMLIVTRLLKLVHRRLAMREPEILCFYGILLIGMPMTSLGIVRYLLPSMTALRYFATPENEFGRYADQVPSWVAPASQRVVEMYYEGSPTGAVPWDAWIVPLLAWTALFGVFFFVLLCLASLMRRQWVQGDKLTFPLVTFNLELIGTEPVSGGIPFFRSPLMWIGFSIVALYNLGNFINAINPSFKSLGLMYSLNPLLTESPWNSLRSLVFYYRPEFVGLGYFVPLEILFSTWAGYFLIKFQSLAGHMIGWEPSGFPFVMRQSLGGYLGMALVLLYTSRYRLAEIWGKLRDAEEEAIPPKVAAGGIVVGLILITIWCSAAGMSSMLALSYFVLLTLIALTFTRARAETGIPTNWAFPYGDTMTFVVDITGSQFWVRAGQVQSLTMLSVMHFFSRGYFPSIMAYQLENMEMARRGKVRLRDMTIGMGIGLVIGLAAAYFMHLHSFYAYGANVLEGGTTSGGYRTADTVQEFGALAAAVKAPAGPTNLSNLFGLAGAIFTVTLAGLRFKYLRLPFHPLGFCLATSYGYLMWGPFLSVWIIKSLVVRLGGASLYRRLGPLFLGIAFGHFFTAGLVWGAFSGLLPQEMFRNLHIDIG